MKRRFYIRSFSITGNAAVEFSYNIPPEYKRIIGVFLVASNDPLFTKLKLSIDNVEILPKEFDAAVITFNGNVSREQVMLPLNTPNSNALVKGTLSEYTGGDITFSIYFEVEL